MALKVSVTPDTAVLVAVSELGPGAFPSFQLPTAAMPFEPVTAEPPVTEPPPPAIANVTETPLTGLLN